MFPNVLKLMQQEGEMLHDMTVRKGKTGKGITTTAGISFCVVPDLCPLYLYYLVILNNSLNFKQIFPIWWMWKLKIRVVK